MMNNPGCDGGLYLIRAGFEYRRTPAQAVDEARRFSPMLWCWIWAARTRRPGGVPTIRTFSDCYILMLTARGSEDKISGLTLGA